MPFWLQIRLQFEKPQVRLNSFLPKVRFYVISYTCVQLKEGDDIDSVAKSALTIALDNADYGWAGDKSTWSNDKGVGLLADIE